MVSASKAARDAKRAADGKAPKKTAASRAKDKSANASGTSSVDDTPDATDDEKINTKKENEIKRLADQMDKHGLSDRVTTGVLSSLKASRDVKITSVSLVFHGRVLITDTTLELTYGRRYGLLGENGCGKSTLLKSIDKREFPIPEHVDIYLLNEGAPPSDLGALEWVVREAENEMERLDKLAEEILENEGPESPVLMDLYEVKILYMREFHTSLTLHSAWRPWTLRLSQPVPPSFSLVSASTRRLSQRRPRTCPEDGVCVSLWLRPCSSSLRFFFSMTQLPIWIWRLVCGWRNI